MRIFSPLLFLLFLSFVSLAQNYPVPFEKGESIRLKRGRIWNGPTSQSKVLASESDDNETFVVMGGIHDRFLTIYSDTVINSYIKVIYHHDKASDSTGWVYTKNIERRPVPNSISFIGLDSTTCKIYLANCEWKMYNDSSNYSKSSYSQLYSRLGTIYFNQGAFFKSIQSYSSSINLEPSNYAIVKRAFAKNELGDFTGVIADLKAVTSTRGDTWTSHGFLSRTFEYSDIDILNTKGYAELKLNKFSDAVLDLTRSITIDSKQNPDAYYYRGFCYLNMRLKPKACLDFSRAGEQGLKQAYKDIAKFCN